MPTFEEVLPDLADAKVFSKVDLKSGYWHVTLDEAASDLTAFQTPYRRCKWTRLPFGLSVSSEIFQRKIHEALGGLAGYHCIADDIFIEGDGETIDDATHSHDRRLLNLLQTCADKGIVLNESKFELRVLIMGFMAQRRSRLLWTCPTPLMCLESAASWAWLIFWRNTSRTSQQW